MLKSALLQAVENHKGNRTGAEWDSHLSQSMISPGKQTRRTFFPAGPPRLSYSDPPKSDFLSTVSDQEQFLLFFPIFFFFLSFLEMREEKKLRILASFCPHRASPAAGRIQYLVSVKLLQYQ